MCGCVGDCKDGSGGRIPRKPEATLPEPTVGDGPIGMFRIVFGQGLHSFGALSLTAWEEEADKSCYTYAPIIHHHCKLLG